MDDSMYGNMQIGGLGAYLVPECNNFWSSLLGETISLGVSSLEDENGWVFCGWNRPPSGRLIQYRMAGWGKPVVGYAEDLNPCANVNGLYWRLTGIGKEGL